MYENWLPLASTFFSKICSTHFWGSKSFTRKPFHLYHNECFKKLALRSFISQVNILKEFPDELTLVFFYNVTATITCIAVGLFAVPNASAWKIGLNLPLISIVSSVRYPANFCCIDSITFGYYIRKLSSDVSGYDMCHFHKSFLFSTKIPFFSVFWKRLILYRGWGP